MTPTTMNAILFDRAGDAAEVLRTGTAPVPVPAEGQVLIRVSTRVIQPADMLFIAARYRVTPQFPQVAGFDGVGVVEAAGSAEDAALIGQRVAFRSPGAWADLAVAPRSRIYPVPDDISDDLACQFSLNPLTAWGLLDMAAPRAGGAVLATAGDSSVTRLVAALALQRGLAIRLVARHGGAGGTGYRAWNPAEPSAETATAATLAELLHTIQPAAGFDAVLDPVGGPATLELMAATAPGGALVSYGVLDDRPFQITAAQVLYRNLRWEGFGIDGFLARLPAPRLAAATEELWALIRAQPALLAPAARFPLDRMADALAASRQVGAKGGKVLLVNGAA